MNHFIMSCAAYIFLFICTLSIAQAKAVDDASGELTPTQQALVKQLSALEGKHAVAGQWEHKALKKFYDTRNGALVWFDKDGEWQRDPEDFERAFQQADMEGLNPDDYRFLALAKQPYTKTNMAALAQRDLQLTNALLHYMRDLSIGRAQPSHVFPKLFLMPEMRDYALTLAAILDEGGDSDIADAFLNLAPKHPDYLALRKALSQYKTLAENKEFWQDIPKGRVIKPGDHDARMPLIRQRMRALGRLDGQNDIFDNLVNMVAEFTADESGEHSDDKEAASDPNPQWK